MKMCALVGSQVEEYIFFGLKIVFTIVCAVYFVRMCVSFTSIFSQKYFINLLFLIFNNIRTFISLFLCCHFYFILF